MSESPTPQLNVIRGLGIVAATSIVIGHIIGQGVFLKARIMTCNVETPAMVILAWFLTGLLTLAGALTISELGTMMPRSGGIYVYLREAYGPRWGFLYGWKDFIIGPAGLAAGAAGFTIFLNVVSGGALSNSLLTFEILGSRIALTGAPLVSVAIIGIVVLINCAAVSVGGLVATILTIFKIFLVLGIGVIAFISADADWSHFTFSGASGSCAGIAESARGGSAGFAAAMLGAYAAYSGWQAVSNVAGEVKNPARNIPSSIIGGVVIVIVLYVFANIAYFAVLTPVEVASVPTDSSVATAAVTKMLGPLSSKLIAVAIMISIFGMMQISSMKNARVVFAMSRHGLLFRSLGDVSPETRVPARAIVLQGVWAMAIVLFGTYDTLVDYQNFVEFIFFALMGVSIFVLRRTRPDAERPYRTLGYPIVPAIYILVTIWIVMNTLLTNPVRSITGLALVAIGLPLYWYRQRRCRLETEDAPPR